MNYARLITVFMIIIGGGGVFPAYALDYEEYPSVRLRSLDKITARTLTFDAQVGSTMKFGDIYIKIQSCRKPPPVEKNESAAFLQIWQVDKASRDGEDPASHWIFSGWMFSSSPALSGMNHPVYDVWVIDCLGKDPEALPAEETQHDQALPSDGTVPEGSVSQPAISPDKQTAPPETPVPEPSLPESPVSETPASQAPASPDAAPSEPAPESNKSGQTPPSPSQQDEPFDPPPTIDHKETIDGIY